MREGLATNLLFPAQSYRFYRPCQARGSSGTPAGVEDIAMTTAALRSAPLDRAAARYWTESRQPLASLLVHRAAFGDLRGGRAGLGPAGVRNGVDALLREVLERLGFSQYFLLPILTVGILLAWHYLTRRPWRVSGSVFYGMIGECVLLAICLRFALATARPAAVHHGRGGDAGHPRRLGVDDRLPWRGVYEELLFRLLLLPLLAWLLRRFRLAPAAAMAGAVLLSSLLFAAAHYIGPYGESHFTPSFDVLLSDAGGDVLCRAVRVSRFRHCGGDPCRL